MSATEATPGLISLKVFPGKQFGCQVLATLKSVSWKMELMVCETGLPDLLPFLLLKLILLVKFNY